MRFFYTLIITFFALQHPAAQTFSVSGECITGTIVLSQVANVNSKMAFQGTGTVEAIPGVTVNIYWLGAPDNVWVLDFDGQPYFQNACTGSSPADTQNGPCPWTVVTAGCTGGSALSIMGAGILPVQWISFTGIETNGNVLLNWKTATETNNKGFDVQYSKDGRNWSTIGSVPAAVNGAIENNYQFTDISAAAGKNYYRLIQQDLDGRRSYSAVVTVDAAGAAYSLAGNNPGNGIYQIRVRSGAVVEIAVLDMTGRILIKQKAITGIHQIDISRYAAGTYLLRLTNGNETVTEKLIKQ